MKRHVTAVAAIVFATFAFVQFAGAAIVTPAGYWQFDDGTNTSPPYASRGKDSSGNSKDFQIFSYAGAPWPAGLIGDAITYDGNGAHRAMRPAPESDGFGNVGGGNFTAQVWYNPNSVAGEQVIFEKFTATSGPGWTFYKNSADYLEFFAKGAGADPNVFITGTTTPAFKVTTGSWQQLVVTRNGNQFDLYRNGVSVATTVSSASVISSSTEPLLLGARGPSYGVVMSGLVDEVAFWNVGLSGADVLALYNAGLAGAAVTTLVPEPATATLLAIGGLFIGMRRRRGV